MEFRRAKVDDPAVVALLLHHHREMLANSPPGTAYVFDIQRLAAPDIELVGGWRSDGLVAAGALRHHNGFGEIKSMRIKPEAVGTGAGKVLLQELINRAKYAGHDQVKLETGSGDIFEPANGLYRSFGFEPCAPFAGYAPSEFNRFYSLRL